MLGVQHPSSEMELWQGSVHGYPIWNLDLYLLTIVP